MPSHDGLANHQVPLLGAPSTRSPEGARNRQEATWEYGIFLFLFVWTHHTNKKITYSKREISHIYPVELTEQEVLV